MCRNPIQKEFLKSHDGFLRHQLTSTVRSANQAMFLMHVWSALKRPLYNFKNSFFIEFLFISIGLVMPQIRRVPKFMEHIKPLSLIVTAIPSTNKIFRV